MWRTMSQVQHHEGEEVAVEEEVQQPLPAGGPADNGNELASLKNKVAEYERLLLDPSYLDFLAGGKQPARSAPQPTRQPQSVDFDNLSNKDLFELIMANMQGMLNGAIQPIQADAATRETVNQVKEAAKAYPDFWNYKDEMIALGKRHPTITADEAYFLAKGRANGRVPKPSKPAPRVEAPTGGANTRENNKGGSFEERFAQAWKESGLTSNRG